MTREQEKVVMIASGALLVVMIVAGVLIKASRAAEVTFYVLAGVCFLGMCGALWLAHHNTRPSVALTPLTPVRLFATFLVEERCWWILYVQEYSRYRLRVSSPERDWEEFRRDLGGEEKIVFKVFSTKPRHEMVLVFPLNHPHIDKLRKLQAGCPMWLALLDPPLPERHMFELSSHLGVE